MIRTIRQWINESKLPDYIGSNGAAYWLTPGTGNLRHAKCRMPDGREMFQYIRTDYSHLYHKVER